MGIIKGQVWNKVIRHDIEKQYDISLYLELYIQYIKWRLRIHLP